MSMINCPVCGNECSPLAESCPQCGHPFVQTEAETIVRQPEVIVPVATTPRRKDFPYWMFVPLSILLVAVIFGFIMLMQNRDETANENVNVRVRARDTTQTRNSSDIQPVSPPQSAQTDVRTPQTEINVPPSSTTLPPVSSVPPSTTSEPATTSIPVTPTKGALAVTATITNRSASKPQPVRREKIYLLDKDAETILSRAGIDPEEGDYVSTCAAAVIDPARSETRSKCLAAIKPHILYSITTDANGKATFKDIKPDNYYLFGMTKSGDSYAVWNTSVNVNAGENSIELEGRSTPVASNSIDEFKPSEISEY